MLLFFEFINEILLFHLYIKLNINPKKYNWSGKDFNERTYKEVNIIDIECSPDSEKGLQL